MHALMKKLLARVLQFVIVVDASLILVFSFCLASFSCRECFSLPSTFVFFERVY